MKFTVVTPSLNQGRFLEHCLESVQRQEGVEVEHIVMDGGSTDETLDILRKFPGLQWQSKPDNGQSDAINNGFQRASGTWLMWLNADDYLLPGALARVATFANAHPEADVIYGGWQFVDPAAKPVKTMYPLPFDLLMLIHYGCYIGSTACFLRRESTVGQGHLLNTEFHYVMDGEYYARLGRAGKRFIPLREILASFRLHGQNESLRHADATSVHGILLRQKQFAETMTIRRAYGWTPFRHPPTDAITDAALWWYCHIKKGITKLALGHYRQKGQPTP